MMDQPTMLELVTAVREFLREKAMPELSGRTQFHALVASNALSIVERQIQQGPNADKEEHDRLRSLLGQEGSLEELNRVLCERIRSGDLGITNDALVKHLWATTMDKLAIEGPRYSAYRKVREEQNKG